MFADGSNGSVEFLGDHIIIRRKGFANVLTQGLQGDKTIPVTSITSVQFRPAGSMMAGLIQFSIRGGREFRGGMLEATKDENAVMFDRSQEPAFIALRDAVQAAIFTGTSAGVGQRSSSADELAKLADLFERGHLSQEEFEQAKSDILRGSKAAPVTSQSELQNPPRPEPKKGMSGCAVAAIFVVGAIVLLSVVGSATQPKWGEPGYRPKISDTCRAVWASPNVDKDRYIATLCTPEEQHEIAGYKRSDDTQTSSTP